MSTAQCNIGQALPQDVVGVIAQFSVPSSVWALRSTSSLLRSKIRGSCSERWNPLAVVVGEQRCVIYKYFWGQHALMRVGQTNIPQLTTGNGPRRMMKRRYDPFENLFTRAKPGIPVDTFAHHVALLLYDSPDFFIANEEDEARWSSVVAERREHETGREDHLAKAVSHFHSGGEGPAGGGQQPVVYVHGFLVGELLPLRSAFGGRLIAEVNSDLLLPFLRQAVSPETGRLPMQFTSLGGGLIVNRVAKELKVLSVPLTDAPLATSVYTEDQIDILTASSLYEGGRPLAPLLPLERESNVNQDPETTQRLGESRVTEAEAEALAPLAALRGYLRLSLVLAPTVLRSVEAAKDAVGFKSFTSCLAAFAPPTIPNSCKGSSTNDQQAKSSLQEACPQFSRFLEKHGGQVPGATVWQNSVDAEEVPRWDAGTWRKHLQGPLLIRKAAGSEGRGLWVLSQPGVDVVVGQNPVSGANMTLSSTRLQEVYGGADTLGMRALRSSGTTPSSAALYIIDQAFLYKQRFCPRREEKEEDEVDESDTAVTLPSRRDERTFLKISNLRDEMKQTYEDGQVEMWQPTEFLDAETSVLYREVVQPMPTPSADLMEQLKNSHRGMEVQVPLEAPWLIVGSADSWCAEHKEPLHSHTWAHLLVGTKHWYLEVPDVATGSLTWVRHEQQEGETVFLPPTVRHFVVNPKGSCLVSRNFHLKL